MNPVTNVHRIAGFSLTELLVAMALAIFLVSGLVQGVVSSKTTFNSINAQTELQQNGRAALFFLEKEILKAGYINNLNVATRFDETKLLEVWPERTDVFDEAGVFITGDQTIAGQDSNTDAVVIRYKIIDSSVSIKACAGTDISNPNIEEVVVSFYIADGTDDLYCQFEVYPIPSPALTLVNKKRHLLSGIESLKIRYGIADTTTMPPKVTQYLTAADIGGTDQPSWADVIGVSLSLLVTSDSNLGAEAVDQNKEHIYTLQGVNVSKEEDGKLRQVFTTTQGLRNRL